MNHRRHADLDAEAGVLGGIFLNNSALGLVSDLEVEDFYDPKHQTVFCAMRNIEHDGVDAIDPITVAAELKRLGKAAPLGGPLGDAGCIGFLLELSLHVPTASNVERYASLLKKHRTSRELKLAAAEVIERLGGNDEDFEGDEAVQWALNRLLRIRSRTDDVGRVLGDLIREELDSLAADLEAIERGERVVTGLPTASRKLDAGTGGHPIGAVSLIMGATGHGKSTYLGASARETVLGDDLAFVYSGEDPLKFWGQRGAAQDSGVPTEAIARRRNLDHALQMRSPGEFAFRRLQKVREQLWRRREVIIPSANWSVDDIIADVRSRRPRMQSSLGGRKRRLAVFIDYIQVVRMVYPRGVEKRTEAIANAMNRLQWLAQGCGIPGEECAVVVASQVKDDVVKERRAPRIDDWADSYATVKVPKLVIGINRPGKYDPKANPILGSLDVLKRNQGDDEVHADVILDLAIHSIRDIDDTGSELDLQTQLGGVP